MMEEKYVTDYYKKIIIQVCYLNDAVNQMNISRSKDELANFRKCALERIAYIYGYNCERIDNIDSRDKNCSLDGSRGKLFKDD